MGSQAGIGERKFEGNREVSRTGKIKDFRQWFMHYLLLPPVLYLKTFLSEINCTKAIISPTLLQKTVYFFMFGCFRPL